MVRVEARHPLLVLRLSALADVVHTIPAVAAIRRSQPGFAIGWVVESAYQDLVEAVAPVDLVFVIQSRRWRMNPLSGLTRSSLFGVLGEIRAFARGGTSIDFQGLWKSAVIGRLSRARERVGFAADATRERMSSILINREIPIDQDRHVIESNMQLAEAVGAAPIDPLSVDFSHYVRDRSGQLSLMMSERPVVLLPGSSRSDKRWPPERFAALAEWISSTAGREVVVGWGPGEEALARDIAGRTSAVRVAPPTDLRELGFLFTTSSCVVGGDTGPLHLAAALRVPLVGLYGPTSPRRNGPWGQIDHCVETWTKSRKMDEIAVKDVIERVQTVLMQSSV